MQNTFLFDISRFHHRTGTFTRVCIYTLFRTSQGGRRIFLFATLPAHPGRTDSPTTKFYCLIKFKITSSTTGSFFLRQLRVVISQDVADTKLDINLCPPENLGINQKVGKMKVNWPQKTLRYFFPFFSRFSRRPKKNIC